MKEHTGETDRLFVGSVPKIYEKYLVPLLFDRYASDMAARVEKRSPASVLETACGTGVVTRALAAVLPPNVQIVATDLNQAMIDEAQTVPVHRTIEWKAADAMQLPFPDNAFDAVVCQFGVMFLPDRPQAYSEAHRVLRPGGVFIFNVWDRIEKNEFPDVVSRAVASAFPEDPPLFLPRTPYGYHDFTRIERDLRAGGFSTRAGFETVSFRTSAPSALVAAVALCEGTPLRMEIEQRGPDALARATDTAERAIRERFGGGEVAGKIQAHVITVES